MLDCLLDLSFSSLVDGSLFAPMSAAPARDRTGFPTNLSIVKVGGIEAPGTSLVINSWECS